MSALLRQPGGFEGLSPTQVLPYASDLAVLDEKHVRERSLERKASSPVGSSNPRLPDNHDFLSRVEIFGIPKLAVPSKLQVVLNKFRDSSLAHISVSVREGGWVEISMSPRPR